MLYLTLPPEPVDSNQFENTPFFYQKVSDVENPLSKFSDLGLLLGHTFDSNLKPISSKLELDRVKFENLVATWKQRCLFSSSISEIVSDPSYMQIIGMGERALPFIIEKLREYPDHYFVALSAITGEDPVSDEDKGNIEKMAQAWIAWAESS